MNELIVKPVDFFGDQLVAIKNEQTGKVYTGVSYICKGIGLNKSQKDTQVQNVQNDLVLNKGCLKFQAGVIDPNNEVLGIELDFLPLWLAKISITPKMKEEQSEVAEKLVNYQLKAKDVLAQAFIHNKPTCIEDVLISSLQEMKAIRGEVQAVKVATQENQEALQGIRDVVAINTSTMSWREDCRRIIVKIAHKLGGNSFIGDVNREIYGLMRIRLKVKLDVKLTNMRRRMAAEGVCVSKRNQANYLDVIEKESRLVEGYVAIVKELAIKYGVDKRDVV